MKKLRHLDNKIQINVNYVIGQHNTDHLFENLQQIESALKGMRLDHFSIEHLAYTKGMDELAQAVDADALQIELERIKQHSFAFPVSATPVIKQEDLGRYYRTFEPFDRINCNVPWIALYVFPDGEVTSGGGMFACTKVLGNLQSEPLPVIWNGKEMRAFRRRIRSEMPADCIRCCHTIHYSPIIRCTPKIEQLEK